MSACKVRQELLRQYSDAAEKLSPLSKELANVALSYEDNLFTRTWERFMHAQQRCEHARRALESHTASHHCLNV